MTTPTELEIRTCYELGTRAAWNNQTIDQCPKYRKQNKAAAWLKGFTDAKLEIESKALQGNTNREGIAKLRAIIEQATGKN